MSSYIQSFLSVLFFIIIGYAAKPLKLFDADTGKRIVKFLFTLPLPILVFVSFASHPLDHVYISLPIIAMVVSGVLMALSYVAGTLLNYEHKSLGTLIVGAGISSTLLFALPFVNAFYGTEYAKYLFLYDFGNGFLAWTLVFYIAGRFGNKKQQKIRNSLLTFLMTPMLWALILGISISFSGIMIPESVTRLSTPISGFANPLLLICVGLFLNFSYFTQKTNMLRLIVSALIVMGASLGIAMILTDVFAIEGIIRKIVLLCAVAPAGSLTVAFAAEHELDLEFASALVAFTMAIGIAVVPLLIIL